MTLSDLLNAVKLIKQEYDPKQSAQAVNNVVKDTVIAVKDSANLAAIPILEDTSEELKDTTNDILLDSFEKLPREEKLNMLRSAVLFHKKDIIHQQNRINFFKEVETFNLKTWVIKVAVGSLILGIFGFVVAFVFVLNKSGIFSNAGIVSSLFKTLQEVISIVFLTQHI